MWLLKQLWRLSLNWKEEEEEEEAKDQITIETSFDPLAFTTTSQMIPLHHPDLHKKTKQAMDTMD